MEEASEGCREESETKAGAGLEVRVHARGRVRGAGLEQRLRYGPRVESGMGSGPETGAEA